MKNIKKITLLITLGLIVFISGCGSGTGNQVGDKATDFTLEDLNGNTVSLSDYKGKPVMVNFWATWCGYCVYEMPFLQEIEEQYADKGLILLEIDVKENKTLVNSFMEYYDFSFTALLDVNGDVSDSYGIAAYPTTFFIDTDGIIQQVVRGAFVSAESIETYLSSIID